MGPHFENSNRLTPEQVASVRRALQSMLSSSAFAGSKRCQLFLRLAVERSLGEDLDSLPAADYDTSNDALSACERQKFERGLHSTTQRLSKPRRSVSNYLPVLMCRSSIGLPGQ